MQEAIAAVEVMLNALDTVRPTLENDTGMGSCVVPKELMKIICSFRELLINMVVWVFWVIKQ